MKSLSSVIVLSCIHVNGCPLQGNCSSKPPNAALGWSQLKLIALKPRQCVVYVNVRLTNVQQSLWLDNIYIRHRQSRRASPTSLLACLGKSCNLWLTSVTLQNDEGSGGLDVKGGQVYAEGVYAGDSHHASWVL
jgi:hypothetical protein